MDLIPLLLTASKPHLSVSSILKGANSCFSPLIFKYEIMEWDIRILDFTVVVVSVFALIISTRQKRKENAQQSSRALPPGPKGLPIIGNLFDIPFKKEWITFTEWGKSYGEIDFC